MGTKTTKAIETFTLSAVGQCRVILGVYSDMWKMCQSLLFLIFHAYLIRQESSLYAES